MGTKEHKLDCRLNCNSCEYVAVAHLCEYSKDDMTFWFGRLNIITDSPLESLDEFIITLSDGRKGKAKEIRQNFGMTMQDQDCLVDFVGLSKLA